MALNFELQGVRVVDEDKTQWIGEEGLKTWRHTSVR